MSPHSLGCAGLFLRLHEKLDNEFVKAVRHPSSIAWQHHAKALSGPASKPTVGVPSFLFMPAPPRVYETLVWLHPEAPAKPAEGEPCNGCGLCCLAEPCPLGVLVSRRTTGACAALRWSDDAHRYVCGMVSDPGGVTGITWPWAARWMAALARRWIASGVGCDAQLDSDGGARSGD